jgi:hypothetical protein
MDRKTFPMERQKRIALLAHDNTKTDLVQWAKENKERLANHELFATGSTGEELEDELGFEVRTLLHGPLGGDLQIGGKISEGRIDFFDLFLGPSHTRLPRYGRSGPHAHGSAVEHSPSLQQNFGGLHDHRSPDGPRVPAAPYRGDRLLRKPLTAFPSEGGIRSA